MADFTNRSIPFPMQPPPGAAAAAILDALGTAPLVGAARNSVSAEAEPRQVIGREQITKATETLKRYKQGKQNLEKRIIEDELWWELRHWEAIRGHRGHAAQQTNGQQAVQPLSTSAWLFNALAAKHADIMDNYPEAVALPREQSDEQSAKIISSVLPCVMDGCEFEQTYSDEGWEKLKHGTSIYSVLWDPDRENGLGDIDISGVDILKLFWEPGIEDLQKSHNIFLAELVDNDDLEAEYPQLQGKLKGGMDIDIAHYLYDDSVDVSNKSVVVDWYYKKHDDLTGRTLLHYVKYCGNEVLFASENDPAYAERGWYDHGLYPFHADVLFPEVGTPVGFGLVAICRDPQLYIDKLFSNVLETSLMGTKRRYFLSDGVDANEQEMLNENKPFVHVTGPVTDERLKEIVTRPLDAIYLSVIQLKIDEMQQTASNRDVNNGGTAGGVTAASAIAALQEAGNKTSRDMISTSYRCHVNISKMCIELMRQFYSTARTFRITNELPYEYVEVTPEMLANRSMGTDADGAEMYRKPVFDIKVKAQKRNPFSRAEQNERAKELYGLGFFNPQRAQEALLALDMMDFEGIDKIKGEVSEGQTLYNVLQQVMAELQQAKQLIAVLTGAKVPQNGATVSTAAPAGGRENIGTTVQRSEARAQTPPTTPMMSRLAARSKPNMNVRSSAAAPRA